MEEQSNAYYVYRGGRTSSHGIGVGVHTVEVDRSVTFIEDDAFCRWRGLRCIRIPDTITRIDWCAFKHCTSLTSVTLPPSLTTIAENVFAHCTSLTDVKLPASLTSIHSYAFDGCTSLTDVTLPASLTSICSHAFEGCTSLVSVTLESKTTNGTASTFINTTMENSTDCFKKILVEAGFSRENPNDILNGQKTYQYSEEDCMYYNLNRWARTRGANGKLLVTAARKSLKWKYTKQIFTANMPAIYQIDSLSGLPLFMLAAAGPTSDIESVYNLLKEFPGSISFNESKLSENISSQSKRKRKRGC